MSSAAVVSTWFAKQLGDGILAQAPSAQICEAFEAMYRDRDTQLDAAVFIRHDSEGHLHCEVTAYFSPTLAELARVFKAHECHQPSRAGLDLLVGDSRCWAVLFGEDK